MFAWKNLCLSTLLACGLASSTAGRTSQNVNQTPPQAQTTVTAPVKTIDQALDRVIAREHERSSHHPAFQPGD